MNELNVTIPKAELLDSLKDHRDAHQEDYLVAYSIYIKKVTVALKDRLDKVENDKEFDLYFDLSEPIHKQEEYAKYIDMLELHNEEYIEVTTTQFDCFMNDTWSWIEHAKFVNATYSSQRM